MDYDYCRETEADIADAPSQMSADDPRQTPTPSKAHVILCFPEE